MKIKVAFDVSGLAWQYRTGVQNLYWAFVDAWATHQASGTAFDAIFYDRSGQFNLELANKVGTAYAPGIPCWLPSQFHRSFHLFKRVTGIGKPELRGCINHVWNWNIYNPSFCSGSITIPDILPLEYPDWFDSSIKKSTESSLMFASGNADFVFAISNDVKQRVVKHTGISSDKIRVVYPGIDNAYFSPEDPIITQTVLKKHGLEPGQFFLSSGFIDPRKNLKRQLEGFKLAQTRGIGNIKYALTGIRTALSDDVLQLIESSELREKVIFLGYVPKDELIGLTSQSTALMYCSIAEGFGLPIIEAMALGAPVITSNNTSMRELAFSRTRLVDPCDVDDIAEAMLETCGTTKEEKSTQLAANRQYASKFTIENWLKGHLDAYVERSTL